MGTADSLSNSSPGTHSPRRPSLKSDFPNHCPSNCCPDCRRPLLFVRSGSVRLKALDLRPRVLLREILGPTAC